MKKRKYLIPTVCLVLPLAIGASLLSTGCSQERIDDLHEIANVAKHLGETETEENKENESQTQDPNAQTPEETPAETTQEPQTEEPETTPAPIVPAGPQVMFANVQGNAESIGNANIHSEPRDDAPVIGLLLKGDVVARDGYETTWSRISYNGRTAYVKTRYLADSDEDASDLTIGSSPIADQKIPTPVPVGVPGVVPTPTKAPEPTKSPKPTKEAEPAKDPKDKELSGTPTPTKTAEPTDKPEPTKEAKPTETPAPTKAPKPEGTAHVASEEQLAKEAPLFVSGPVLDRAAMSALPNDTIPWGYVTDDRDEFNRPNGCLYYQRLYGKYNATFIRENTNVIYLTMDEGYEGGYTPKILDVLKEKNVKATFFCTYDFIKKNPDLVERMIKEGHVVGNHTDSHPSGGIPQYGMDFTQEDIMRVHNYVKDNFGYEMYLFRYPEGAFSEQSLALVQSLGYESVFWGFAHKDWDQNNQPDQAVSLQRVTNQLHPGAVYLLHAVSETNTEILGDFIDNARAQGYEFGYYAKK